MPKPKRSYTAQELADLLALKFSDTRRFAVFPEVGNGTGWGVNSWIDLAVIHLWPSDGDIRKAIEIKVSRSDFLKELSNPTKNQWAKNAFHEFWFLTPKEGVIKDGELPDGVGWYYPRGDTICVGKHAKRTKPKESAEFMIAAFARAAQKHRERGIRDYKRTMKTSDPEYKYALMVQKTVSNFVMERGGHWLHKAETEAGIISILEKATLDAESQNRRKVVMDRLDKFKARMNDLLMEMIILSQIGFFERDDAGEFIVKQFGGKDELSLAAQRILATKKENSKNLFDRDRAKNSILVNQIMNAVREAIEEDGSGI